MNPYRTILIVDDEPVGRQLLTMLLGSEGYQLALAENGPDALQQASTLLPDLVLLDVMMPGMSGFEVCHRLRADPVLAEVPILLITALDDQKSRVQGLEAGADDFISKPYDRMELRARVRSVIRLNRFRRLLAERSKFEWVVSQAEEGYILLAEQDEMTYLNPRARRYLEVDEQQAIPQLAFLGLVRKHHRLEPVEQWQGWPDNLRALNAPRYLIRPESPQAPACWLRVEILEIPDKEDRMKLVRLRDVTREMVRSGEMWKFQSAVNHKLRTPLGALMSGLELLATDLPSFSQSDVQELLDVALQGSQRLFKQIEGVLLYMGSPTLGDESLNLADISGVLGAVAQSLALQEVKLTSNVDLESTHVTISRSTLELMLREILENAQKFHPRHAPRIEVQIGPYEGGRVQLRIIDDGLTLSAEQRSHLLQPYYQVEKYFTGEVPGMGLGLSTIAHLLWEVGGDIQVSNRTDGPGLVVTLVLPSSPQ